MSGAQRADVDRRTLMRRMFDAAVAAAQPARCLAPHLPQPPRGRTIVIGAGKASAAMARALEDHWPGEIEGSIVTRYGYAVPCRRIEILEAAHPVPDESGMRATARILERVAGLGPEDLVIALISGGGSSLLVAPPPGITLADKQALATALLKSGATIAEMNVVRRHLSAVKGGRLAAACHPARVVTLLISDVPGDDPVDIASGPTVPDATTCADALAILERYGIDPSPAVLSWLRSDAAESIKPGDPRLARSEMRIVTSPQVALEARLRRGQPVAPPCVLLSGGETTVTVKGRGRGGRNVEFLLSLGLALRAHPQVHAIACDTDGVDGQEEIAGAVLTPDSLARARALGIVARERLDDNDGHGFFQALDDSVVTGPTHTNVNDFRAIVIERCEGGGA